ncbi:cytochrome b-c1 complex subunit 8 [Aspergillus campestris IBT 28561]|uniref:Cytochrome b-c1 complex subunit 8 n=1 Tax=Aspergillus campestris (strain IBT 28561) TaxID=1392248 RepID=A0A2I1DGB3_ASPC2|nr:cytochrome b-c1 complex subunit 8 [Aspergillus campestris IBT 28561]PKY08911.1 cytochrome b-c1 complex subunit 8 [Aspergillus campestris IBT 28561]
MGAGSIDPKNGVFMGGWGNFGCPTPQRIATYSLSPNRQRPLAGAFNAAIFNTFRRCKAQVLYVVPPFVAAYAAMNWAIERNHYLQSKPGRLAEGGDE